MTKPPFAPNASQPTAQPANALVQRSPDNAASHIPAAALSPATPQHPRRILAIWCAQLSVDRWRLTQNCERGQGVDAEPVAFINETAHGPRIAHINEAAHKAGAKIGTMLADARVLCPSIKAVAADPAGDLDFLEKLAVWAQRWGPWSALDAPDGIIVDITAVGHLFGGEARLIADVEAALNARKIAARTAIAPTAGAAWALAHYGPSKSIVDASAPAHILHALLDLPVAALRLLMFSQCCAVWALKPWASLLG